MTSAPKDIREEDLVAYVDDALPPDRRKQVEAYLNDTPEAARRVEADMAIARDLRHAFAGLVADHPMATLPVAERRRHMPLARSRCRALWPKPSPHIALSLSRSRTRSRSGRRTRAIWPLG